MSFDPDPKWTEKINDEALQNIRCPYCKQKPANYDDVTEEVYNASCYNARHIPPSLTFTCFNDECEHCDRDFTVNLKLTIEIA